MAISANAVYEMRTTATASNTNGGGFVTGASGTDYSQQDAAQIAVTDGSAAGAGSTLDITGATAALIGNIANVISGTNVTAGRYEITNVVGTTVTFDRAVTTGATADATVRVGGAWSELTDAILETMVAGNKLYVRDGNYTVGAAISLTAAGSSLKSIEMIGYSTSRTDYPTGSTRPNVDYGANSITFGAFWKVRGMIFTGTSASAVTAGADNVFIDCSFTNTSGTANRSALVGTSRATVIRCELVSTAGNGASGAGTTFDGCYFHDSVEGIRCASTTNGFRVIDSIFDTCSTAAITTTAACTDLIYINNCTLYGAETPTGTGVSILAGTTNLHVSNCIVYGFTTGINHGTASQTSCTDFNNMFFNNTTNATNWTLDTTSSTGTNPGFTNAAQGNFAASNAIARAGGEPGVFPGALTTGYPAIGAVQPSASGSDMVPDLEI